MRLGIDFGTTHTVVSLADRGNYPVVSFDGGEVVPSLVAVRETDGTLRFGAAAQVAARRPGWHLVRSLKRILDDAGPDVSVTIAGRVFPVSDLLEGFLGHLRRELLRRSNAGFRRGETLRVAAGVPANALGAQRLLTQDAFRRAGFEVEALVNEPSAAGFEYAHRHARTLGGRRELVVIYDLGGGTFDASLVRVAEGEEEVVDSVGVSRLGGDDFDEAILGLVLERAGLSDPTPDVREALLDEVRQRKEGVGPRTQRFVADLAAAGLPPLGVPVEEVYEACAPLVRATVEAMEPLAGGLDWREVAGIYTVGGGSGFPLVWRALRERFGQQRVRRSPHPFAATAIGLAIFQDGRERRRLADRLTRHVGVWREWEEGTLVTFDAVFPRGTPLPAPGTPPLEEYRRYHAAHNIGHFRFVECAGLKDGLPAGDLLPWGDLLVPFDPALRATADLTAIPVKRLANEGPLVEERWHCGADGIVRVTVDLPESGISRTFSPDRHPGALAARGGST